LRRLSEWAGEPWVEAGHSRYIPVREEARAGPSSEGGAWFVRVRCRLRVDGDMSSGLVLVT
jgi:hypothetical protein